MRHELGELKGQRFRFRGIFWRHGSKTDQMGRPTTTLLLRFIRLAESGEQVADHLWFTETKGFEALEPLEPGDCLEFNARVTRYSKGYAGQRKDADGIPISLHKSESQDWRLSFPTKITKNDAMHYSLSDDEWPDTFEPNL